MTIELIAPAKINLALHITGQRNDGYHTLDSLVAFGPMGDKLQMAPSDETRLHITGPFAADLPLAQDNLILRALAAVAPDNHFDVILEKNLPVASGIGGGSADAAAAIRGALILLDKSGLFEHLSWDSPMDTFRPLAAEIQKLGADVPMCLAAHSCRAGGVGEKISFLELPPVPVVLVNPNVPISTPAVFKALHGKENPPLPTEIPSFTDAANLIDWLSDQRNDLAAPAQTIAPEIGDAIDALQSQSGCGLARMSGSGATCFGLFADENRAKKAAEKLAIGKRDWWVAGGYLHNSDKWTLKDLPQAMRDTT